MCWFGCGRGRISLYHAHTGRSWCSCLPAVVSAELLPTGGLSHETGINLLPLVLPTQLTQARVPLNPSLCCPASGQRPHERITPSTPTSVWGTASVIQTSPGAQGAGLPISEAGPQVFATLSLCTKTSISTEHKNSSSHFSIPFAVGGFPAWHGGSVEKTHEVLLWPC